MKPSLLSELILYRYRYVIGYVLFVLFVCSLMLVDINTVPNGVSDREMASSVASNSLNPLAPNAHDVISLPYHLLQKASIGLFGLSPLTIRLPSLLLGLTASAMLAITLAHWFRRGVAIIALLLATTSVPFITFARTGTAEVFYMLLLLIVLLGAVKLTTKSPHPLWWKMVILGAGLLLFYMPFGVYAVLALAVAGIFHPHVRYQLKHTTWWEAVTLGLLGLLLLTPLIIAGVTDRQTLEILIGVDELRNKLSLGYLGSSLALSASTAFSFLGDGPTDTPSFSLPFVLLIFFGLVRTIIDHHAARSWLLHIWVLISIPLLLLDPHQFVLLFVPCLMLMAIGLETFLREWYRLFPRNPYARIAALIPLSLIVIGLIAIASSRYFFGYYYSDKTALYHPELFAVRQTLKPHVATQLVVPANQVAFYDILRAKYNQVSIVGPDQAGGQTGERIVLDSSGKIIAGTPKRIVTSYLTKRSVLLRVYSGTE